MENPSSFASPGGIEIPQIGNPFDTDSFTTFIATHRIHHVEGTGTISTITPPWDDFIGPLILLATHAFTWDAAGNIAVALGGAAIPGLAYPFYYDRQLNKWYPTNTSYT